MENLEKLIEELRTYQNETPWLEFKHKNFEPEMIGKDISALANGATLFDRDYAYMIWGIDDVTHKIVGTNHDLQNLKKGNQELECWLRSMLSENVDFSFESIQLSEGRVAVLVIHCAVGYPVAFQKTEYIRIGSYTKRANEYPTCVAQLWDKLRNNKFEDQFSMLDLSLTNALSKLDYTNYFDLLGVSQPSSEEGIAHYMLEEKCIVKQDNGLYAITNLGAVLLGRKLTEFDRVSRKAIRVARYEGNSRLNLLKEDIGNKGYVIGFEGLMKYIEALVPTSEIINGALREKHTTYPMLAIREIISNALIHQDFTVSGTGPLIEVFDDRIEVTNSGKPLVDVRRIVDNPPKSRNENLASLMRRMKMCEELGTGWDKIVISCEIMKLPAPKIDIFDNSTRVTIYANRAFSSLSLDDKVWACYLHACIMQVQGDCLTNSSLRNRFGLKESSSGSISRLIKETVSLGLIKPLDPTTAPRYMKYVPCWA